jgi:hypothetical protein
MKSKKPPDQYSFLSEIPLYLSQFPISASPTECAKESIEDRYKITQLFGQSSRKMELFFLPNGIKNKSGKSLHVSTFGRAVRKKMN